ncbi:MAG: alpha/beta hydrolase family protein [Armatimonadota bacterium]
MEQFTQFQVNGSALYGVLHLPEGDRATRGVVFLHGWSGTRCGPHDMLVKAARAYCGAGVPSLRFDFRGRGESQAEMMRCNLETMVQDTQAACEELQEQAQVEEVVLVGICSGGEVAIGAGSLCPAATGMALWSVPMVAADRTASRRRKQLANLGEYGRKLFRRETWQKAFSGQLNLGLIKRALSGKGGAGETPTAGGNPEDAPPEPNIPWRERFDSFRGRLLFVYGTNDPTTPESVEHYRRMSAAAGIEADFHLVEGANHAYYSLAWEKEVIDVTLDWLRRDV